MHILFPSRLLCMQFRPILAANSIQFMSIYLFIWGKLSISWVIRLRNYLLLWSNGFENIKIRTQLAVLIYQSYVSRLIMNIHQLWILMLVSMWNIFTRRSDFTVSGNCFPQQQQKVRIFLPIRGISGHDVPFPADARIYPWKLWAAAIWG